MANTNDKQLIELLQKLKSEPTSKLLTEPLKKLVKTNQSTNKEVELASLQILIAIKFQNKKTLENAFGLNFDKLRPKFSRTFTKNFMQVMLDAISVLEKLKAVTDEDIKLLQVLKDAVNAIKEGKTLKEQTTKPYENEHMKEVLTQFEVNQSIVYLMGLINKVYREELPKGRVNRALGAFEVLLAIKEDSKNQLLQFGKLTKEELVKTFRASLSKELLNISYQASRALEARTEEIKFKTPSLTEKIKEIRVRFENVIKKETK